MPAVLTGVKIELLKRNKKARDLSDALNLPYSRVNRYLNGYDNPPLNFDRDVQRVFAKWDSEDGRKS